MLGTVVEFTGYDPVAGSAVTFRAASHDLPEVCHLNGQTWLPAIAKLPRLKYDLFDGAFEGKITSPTSSMSFGVEPWPNFGRVLFADGAFKLWTGEVGSAWSGWTLRFDGRIASQPKVKDGRADIEFGVDDSWLDKPLLATYAGTTGAEGPAAMKGQAKPLALGAPRYVPGKLIDSVNSIFQLSAYGAVNGVEMALERLQRFGDPVGDYASHAALVAAAVPKGRWATANAVGMVKFGAPTTGLISFLLQGDVAGPNGWARKPGALIRRIAQIGGGLAKVDDASLDALDAARPYNCSIYLDEQTTARDVIQRLAASVNAVAGVSWLGKLFVLPVAIGTPTLTLAANGSALPPVSSVEQIEIATPFAKLAIGAERTWAVHALSDIAFTAELIDRGDYSAAESYREGHIIQREGSTWLYINPTPTSGNAPPSLPTESNSYWRVLARAGSNGTPGSPGANGQTPYAHFAYANSADGTANFDVSDPTGRTYIGVYSDFTVADSTNPASYTWSLIKGADGTNGSPGQNAKSLDVSPGTVIVNATAAGVTVPGQYPKVVTIAAMDGSTPTSPGLSITISDTANITAVVEGQTVKFTKIDIDGWVDVSATGYPTKRVAVQRNKQGAAGSDATENNASINVAVGTGSGAESFGGAPSASSLILKCGPSGSMTYNGYLEYYSEIPSSGIRRITVKAMLYYRVAGSGSGWSVVSGPAVGSQAEATATTDPLPGQITVGGSVSGLSVGVIYEFAAEFRRNSTTGSTGASGSMETSLSTS